MYKVLKKTIVVHDQSLKLTSIIIKPICEKNNIL